MSFYTIFPTHHHLSLKGGILMSLPIHSHLHSTDPQGFPHRGKSSGQPQELSSTGPSHTSSQVLASLDILLQQFLAISPIVVLGQIYPTRVIKTSSRSRACFHLIFLKVRLAFCLDVLLITAKAFPILLCLKCLIQASCGTRSITFSTASSVSPDVSNRHSVY